MKRTSSILTVLLSLIAVVFFGSLIAGATGLSPLPVIGVLLIGSLIPLKLNGVAYSALNITELNTKLGAYFRKDKGQIFTKMLLGMNIDDRFEIWDDCKDEVPLPNLTITDLVKPANNTTFQPTSNALAFGARILKVRPWKVDLQIVPADLEKSWLGAYKKKGSKVYDMPFEQYVMNHIIEKVQENLRLKSLFKGVYNAAGSTPIDVMDGLLTLIASEITATNIAPVATGAITSTNVVDKLEQTYDALGEAYKGIPTIALVSPQIFSWYKRKYRLDFGGNQDYAGMPLMETQLDGTLCTIKSEPGLGTSQRVIVTPKENLVYGVDSIGEENDINSQVFERTIKLMIDAKSGTNFKRIDAELLAVNDQA